MTSRRGEGIGVGFMFPGVGQDANNKG
jgi:hypothetical protein